MTPSISAAPTVGVIVGAPDGPFRPYGVRMTAQELDRWRSSAGDIPWCVPSEHLYARWLAEDRDAWDLLN